MWGCLACGAHSVRSWGRFVKENWAPRMRHPHFFEKKKWGFSHETSRSNAQTTLPRETFSFCGMWAPRIDALARDIFEKHNIGSKTGPRARDILTFFEKLRFSDETSSSISFSGTSYFLLLPAAYFLRLTSAYFLLLLTSHFFLLLPSYFLLPLSSYFLPLTSYLWLLLASACFSLLSSAYFSLLTSA